MLASNYFGITEHPLLTEIEELKEKANVTPTDVVEQLMRNKVPEIALRGLNDVLEIKHMENDESKAKEAKEERADDAPK